MITKIIQRRGKNIMRDITIKMFLIGLVFFLSKATVLAQDQDIKCEVSGVDFNLSGSKSMIEFGSFSLFAEGEESKENEGMFTITRFYKFPRTNLIISTFVFHYPKDKPTPSDDMLMRSFDDTLVVLLFLGKKRVSIFSDLDDEKVVKDAVSLAQTGYPVEFLNKGGKGVLSTSFFGKKKPIHIIIKCKKLKKAGK